MERVKRIGFQCLIFAVLLSENPRTCKAMPQIDHFTVLCSVTWHLNGSEAGVDLVLTSQLLLGK